MIRDELCSLRLFLEGLPAPQYFQLAPNTAKNIENSTGVGSNLEAFTLGPKTLRTHPVACFPGALEFLLKFRPRPTVSIKIETLQ